MTCWTYLDNVKLKTIQFKEVSSRGLLKNRILSNVYACSGAKGKIIQVQESETVGLLSSTLSA